MGGNLNEQGKIYGNYAIRAHVSVHWSCGLNTHRLPYNARNHEYYSEDGVLGGYLGANMIRGGREKGFIISPKHYAFNDTELNITLELLEKGTEKDIARRNNVSTNTVNRILHNIWIYYK